MMQRTFTGFILFALTAAKLSHALPQDTKYKELAINHESMTVISSEQIAPDYHLAVLSFQILPTNNCEENYAGVFESKDNDFTVVYAYRLGTACPNFAYARYVQHAFHLKGDARVLDVRVNDKGYVIKKSTGGWKIEPK